MKEVFSNSTIVCHVFAQRTQSEGRSSNVFFEGDKIYSYGHHYLLAEFITAKGETAILINDKGYSVTTSKHICQIRQATRQYKQFFVMSTDGTKVLEQLETLAKKLQAARKPELYITQAKSLLSSYNDWLQWSGRKYKEQRQINIVSAVFDGGKYPEYMKKREAAIRAAEKRAAKAALKDWTNKIQKFEAYEIDHIYTNFSHRMDWLRVSQDNTLVETSQGVKIPVKEARVLYLLIKAGKDIKGHEITDGYSKYTVISINGTLKVGCHNIDIKAVNKVGEKILSL